MIKELMWNLTENKEFFRELVLSHVRITLITVMIAIAIGLLIGIFISEHRKLAGTMISVVNVVYTIPSIALLGILITITGIGNTTAIIALTIYALLPIVRSTYTGIVQIDEKIIEASEAMGSRKGQILLKIKLPLALPIIFSAIRNMVTMTIALAGIASFVGAGGLGVAIYRGITTNNRMLILSGSLLIALLAILFDVILGRVERLLSSRRKDKKRKVAVFGSLLGILVLWLFTMGIMKEKNVIKLASKPTTEGYLLGEIVRQALSERGGFSVKMTHGVGGGTANLHPATVRGDFDLYPEYTGTSWQVVLQEKGIYSEDKFQELKDKYEKEYGLTWRGMLGFNNTYGLGVRKEIAEKFSLKTYSDLAKHTEELVFGAEYDFFEREDGFQALSKAYGFSFGKTVDMDNGLKYQALLNGKIDVMTIFTTDGQLSDERIVVLEDDRNFYPSYRAGMVVRMDALEKYSKLEERLIKLENILDEETMARLNFQVEIGGKKPEEVAREFLLEKGLVKVDE